MSSTASDSELKARHRKMWASGDYPSMVETFLLPERVFNDPTARAMIVLRKALTRDPKAFRLDVADGMRLIQVKPEAYRNDAVVQLGLRIAHRFFAGIE